jgi:hypothetical protein
MEGVDAAYFDWPMQPGLIHAAVNLIQMNPPNLLRLTQR